MFYRVAILIFIFVITSGCSSENEECSNDYCIIEGRIKSSNLIAVESNDLFTSASKVRFQSGEQMTLIGDCAFGNEPGTYIKVKYSEKYPSGIEKILRYERLPTSIVPSLVLERRVFSDFTPPEGAVFSAMTLCY